MAASDPVRRSRRSTSHPQTSATSATVANDDDGRAAALRTYSRDRPSSAAAALQLVPALSTKYLITSFTRTDASFASRVYNYYRGCTQLDACVA